MLFNVDSGDILSKECGITTLSVVKVENNLNFWGQHLKAKFSVLFIRPTESKYFLCLARNDGCLLGIYDLDTNSGVVVEQSNWINLDELDKLQYVVVPRTKVNQSNPSLGRIITESSKVDILARELLVKICVSPQHKNKTPMQQALLALNLSNEYYRNFKDLSTLLE